MSTSERRVWLVDRNGASIEDDVSLERFDALVETIQSDDDPEHASISLSDQDGWNVEVYRQTVLFENVEPGGGEVGTIHGASREELRDIAREFLDGDFEALQSRPWA